MKSPAPSTRRALTLSEVLVVIAILVILAGMLFPGISHPKAKSKRIACVNNLKNIGLALRVFSTDHGGDFPMNLAVTNGGAREWMTDETQLWRYWLTLSNELRISRLLLCPSDKGRPLSNSYYSYSSKSDLLSWDQFTNNSHLSYFLGLNASEENPQTILAGDRNLTTNDVAFGPGRLLLTTNLVLGFTHEIHNQAGNILLGDGSVQQVSNGRMQKAWHAAAASSGLTTNVWLVP